MAAQEAGERLLEAAESGDDTEQLLQAHHSLWPTFSAMGQAAAAVVHMERGLALYNQRQHSSHASLYGGHDPGACCRYHLAANLWLLGRPDRSLNVIAEAMALAEELKHPVTLVITLWFTAWVRHLRGDRKAVAPLVEHVLALEKKHGISGWGNIEVLLAWAKSGDSPSRQELEELRGRLTTSVAPVSSWRRAVCLTVLAGLYGEIGCAVDGLSVLGAIPSKDRDAIYAPEMLRMEGELRWQVSSADNEIERCFGAALALSCKRQEKSLELRAATSLARLRRDQGDRAEARNILAPIYGWFNEGFETHDLIAAKTLLEQLGN